MTEEKTIETWKCPVCGSENIDCFDECSGYNEILECYSCADCNSQWNVVYVLDSIANILRGDSDAEGRKG